MKKQWEARRHRLPLPRLSIASQTARLPRTKHHRTLQKMILLVSRPSKRQKVLRAPRHQLLRQPLRRQHPRPPRPQLTPPRLSSRAP